MFTLWPTAATALGRLEAWGDKGGGREEEGSLKHPLWKHPCGILGLFSRPGRRPLLTRAPVETGHRGHWESQGRDGQRERAWRGAERSGVELRQAREEGGRLAALWRCQLPFAAPARTLPGTHLQTRLIRGRVICLQCPDRVKHALCGKWNSTTCSPPFLSLKKREKKNGKHDHKALSIALVGLNGKRRTLDNVATRGWDRSLYPLISRTSAALPPSAQWHHTDRAFKNKSGLAEGKRDSEREGQPYWTQSVCCGVSGHFLPVHGTAVQERLFFFLKKRKKKQLIRSGRKKVNKIFPLPELQFCHEQVVMCL